MKENKEHKLLTIIEQTHRSLPQKMTKEKLAKFITENQKQVIDHIDKLPLTPEQVNEYEHKSSMASRAIDKLDEVKADFMHFYKKGTAANPDGKGGHIPQDIKIPATKGVDALKKNREHADGILEKGYLEETTKIYMIPSPDDSQMVGVTIEGYEAPEYTRKMRDDEEQLYGKLFIKQDGELKQLDNAEVTVNGNGTAQIRPKKNKREPII